MFHKSAIVFLSSFLFINCFSLCDVTLAVSLNFLFFQLFSLQIILTSSHTGEWPVVFLCWQRPIVFLSFAIFFNHPYVISFFLSIFYLFHLYTFLNNYYSLLHKVHLKFPFYPFVLFVIVLLSLSFL